LKGDFLASKSHPEYEAKEEISHHYRVIPLETLSSPPDTVHDSGMDGHDLHVLRWDVESYELEKERSGYFCENIGGVLSDLRLVVIWISALVRLMRNFGEVEGSRTVLDEGRG
jgi:hypothetical protein